MKPTSNLLLMCGLALAVGCGARSPMDDVDDNGGWQVGGTWGSGGYGPGGSPGAGGKKGSGGLTGYGGSIGAGGFIVLGGRLGGGGSVTTRGRAGGAVVSGGSGGNVGGGGQGGVRTGGSGGTRITGTGGAAGGGSGGRGGSGAVGGTGSGGAGGVCAGVAPCGGDVLGTWNVTSSCLNVSGPLDLSPMGLNCSTGTVEGSLQVSGTWTALPDGTYVDKTTTTGKQQLTLPAACLNFSGTTVSCSLLSTVLTVLGYESISCASATGGGCTCWVTVNQTGWPGIVTPGAMTTGKYTASGTVVSLDNQADYAYCAPGNRMVWAPQGLRGTKPTITGAIAFENTSRPGTGGSGGGGSSGAGGASACPPLSSNEELIDDLNDGDRYLPPLSGRVGAWRTSHDNSPNAKMFPDGDFVPSQTGDPCRKYAAYVYGGGYVDWGASFWFGLGAPYNASKYKGLSFWGRVDANTAAVIRVAFPDKDTDPDGNLCSQDASAGANACYDHYGQRVTMTTTWTKYTVSFANLTHGSWGRGSSFDPTTVYEVLFQIQEGASFGYWIDDVAFTF